MTEPLQLAAPASSPPRRVLIAEIVTLVCAELHQASWEVYSPERRAGVALARNVAMWMAYATGRRRTVIGRQIGGRHRTTVHSAIRRVETLRAADPRFAALTNDLLARVA